MAGFWAPVRFSLTPLAGALHELEPGPSRSVTPWSSDESTSSLENTRQESPATIAPPENEGGGQNADEADEQGHRHHCRHVPP